MREDYWRILESPCDTAIRESEAVKLLRLLPSDADPCLYDSRFSPDDRTVRDEAYQKAREKIEAIADYYTWPENDSVHCVTFTGYESLLLAEVLFHTGTRTALQWATLFSYDVLFQIGKCWSRAFFSFAHYMDAQDSKQCLDYMQDWLQEAREIRNKALDRRREKRNRKKATE